MTQENKQRCPYHYDYVRLKACEEYFIAQYQLLIALDELTSILRKDVLKRDGKPEPRFELNMLLPSLISNSKSIINLINGNFVPESYIISRSFFEKCVNYCYLNVCDENEYENYIDWFYQKNMRSFYTSEKALRSFGKKAMLPDISEMTSKFKVLKKFSGKKGGEKSNWTDVSIYQRIKYVETKIPSFPGPIYIATLNTIYENASENLHGTLYGATFHMRSLYGAKMTDEAKQQHLIGLAHNIYFFLAELIDGIFDVVSTKISVDELMNKSKDNAKKCYGKIEESFKEGL